MTNQRRKTALVVIAVAAAVAAGGLMASNMGFKLNYPLQGPEGACPSLGPECVSNSGRQSIGLPYNRQVGIDTASELIADVVASGVTATQLEKFDIVTDSQAPYPGTAGDFGLEEASGYLLRTLTSGDYIIVGSHDPGYAVPLQGPEGTCPGAGCVSNSGRNHYAHPYHGVAATASELIAELSPDALQLERFNPQVDAYGPYPGTEPDFPLVPGESYLLRMINSRSFTPAHY